MSEERRQAFRIDDFIYLRLSNAGKGGAKKPAQEQVERDLTKLRELGQQSNHFLMHIRKSHPEISQYLSIIDKKITILTRLVAAEQFDEAVEPNTNVNISSTGLSVLRKTAIKSGTLLDVHMVFFPSYLSIQCQAVVIYCRQHNKVFRLGLEFTNLDEEASEQMIRHLIERQSEQIRKQRSLEQ